MKTEKQQLKNVSDLEPGDIVVGKSSGLAFIVTDIFGDYAIAVRTQHISNASEWEVFKKNEKMNLKLYMKQIKGDIKICMTCGSDKDLLKCNSGTALIRYECVKCRGVKMPITKDINKP